jgi:phosphatidylserine/phosphatidylglycerophosphate/cardiolipin synthase-like enzyme
MPCATTARELLQPCLEVSLQLIVQPADGVAPLVDAMRHAHASIDVMIFRWDQPELEAALVGAVARGVCVRTLIAHTNSEGERSLRKLELRLLAGGVMVARTADDLVRYHAKYLLVDRRRLFVLGFNFTGLDIARSRSFGVEVRSRPLVQDVLRLFEADTGRQSFTAATPDLVVSPENARARLTALIRSARRRLLVYDPKLSDPRMLRLLHERARAGVDVRIIGRVGKAGAGLTSRRLTGRRLHVRALVADNGRAFIGSQSLRRLELDARRELGLIVRDRRVVGQLAAIFEDDWARSAGAVSKADEAAGQRTVAVEAEATAGA